MDKRTTAGEAGEGEWKMGETSEGNWRQASRHFISRTGWIRPSLGDQI